MGLKNNIKSKSQKKNMKDVLLRLHELKEENNDFEKVVRILYQEGYNTPMIEKALDNPITWEVIKNRNRHGFWVVFYSILTISGILLMIFKGFVGVVFLVYLCYLFIESILVYFVNKASSYDKSKSYFRSLVMSLILVIITVIPLLGYTKTFVVLGILYVVYSIISHASKVVIPIYCVMFLTAIGFNVLILRITQECLNHLCL